MFEVAMDVNQHEVPAHIPGGMWKMIIHIIPRWQSSSRTFSIRP